MLMYMNRKINTWDILLGKGLSGLNIFQLCSIGAEFVEHLLSFCPFGKEVYQDFALYFGLMILWED